MRQTRAQVKTTWLFIVMQFTLMPVLLGVVLALITPKSSRPVPSQLVIGFTAVGVTCLVVAAVLAQIRLKSPRMVGGQHMILEPQNFMAETLIPLAFSEMAALLGFVMGLMGPMPIHYWAYAGASVGVNLLLIMPQGLKYLALLGTARPQATDAGSDS